MFVPARSLVAGAIAAQAALAVYQVPKYDESYLDLDAVGAELAMHWRDGDTLASDHSWVLVNDLMGRGLLQTPWRVYDSVRIDLESTVTRVGPCAFDFLVLDDGPFSRQPLREVLASCGEYVLLHTEVQRQTQLSTSGFDSVELTIELYGRRGGGDDRRQAIAEYLR